MSAENQIFHVMKDFQGKSLDKFHLIALNGIVKMFRRQESVVGLSKLLFSLKIIVKCQGGFRRDSQRKLIGVQKDLK